MGIGIVVTRHLFEPLPEGGAWFSLKDATSRVLRRQPDLTLSHAIDAVITTLFNPNQLTRLVQEFRFLAQESDDVTRQDLEDAAAFIERETGAIGPGTECYVAFLGD